MSQENTQSNKIKEYARMIVVLTVIAAVCGFLLATVKDMTALRIEEQLLVNVKSPAVKSVLAGSDNDLLKDRRAITVDGVNYTVFIGKKDGKPWAVAFESKGAGFGGDIGIMTGFYLDREKITGIGILTHQETPGLGARIVEPIFKDQFKDLPLTTNFNVKKDNGKVDAVSGATNSSRGVCTAIRESIARWDAVKKAVTKGIDNHE